MNKIQECVEKLLEVIREDSAYQRYLACEEMLKSNPELKKQIDEFRVGCLSYEQRRYTGRFVRYYR